MMVIVMVVIRSGNACDDWGDGAGRGDMMVVMIGGGDGCGDTYGDDAGDGRGDSRGDGTGRGDGDDCHDWGGGGRGYDRGGNDSDCDIVMAKA